MNFLLKYFGHCSDKVDSKCGICNQMIEYIYIPIKTWRGLSLLSFPDIEIVNKCRKCETLRHLKCSSKMNSEYLENNNITAPSLLEAMLRIKKGDNDFMKGLNCPKCGNSTFIETYISESGEPIEVLFGRRTK